MSTTQDLGMYRIPDDQMPQVPPKLKREIELELLKKNRPKTPRKPRIYRPFNEVPAILYRVMPNYTEQINKTTVGPDAGIGYTTIRYCCWVMGALNIFWVNYHDDGKLPRINTMHKWKDHVDLATFTRMLTAAPAPALRTTTRDTELHAAAKATAAAYRARYGTKSRNAPAKHSFDHGAAARKYQQLEQC